MTRSNLGNALLAGAQCAEALTDFQEAIRLRPDLAVVHHNLGNAFRILGRAREARASYQEAIRLDPRLALSYLHIGMTYRFEGALDDALPWYKLAVELAPDDREFWEELAGLHDERGDPAEAVACRRRACDLTPAGPPTEIGPGNLAEQDALSSGEGPDWENVCFSPLYVHAGLPLHGDCNETTDLLPQRGRDRARAGRDGRRARVACPQSSRRGARPFPGGCLAPSRCSRHPATRRRCAQAARPPRRGSGILSRSHPTGPRTGPGPPRGWNGADTGRRAG